MPDVERPTYHFEELTHFEDALDPVEQHAGGLHATRMILQPIGVGHEPFLEWALKDVRLAGDAESAGKQARYSTSALMNARRALSCLVDEFLARDGYAYCMDAPKSAEKRSEVLVAARIFDRLASKALARAVKRRNRVEHQYVTLDVEQVEDTVHAVRAAIRGAGPPFDAPGSFGGPYGSSFSGPSGSFSSFGGWGDVVSFVFVREAEPWFGIVIPGREVTVRRIKLKQLKCDELLRLLRMLRSKSASNVFSGIDSRRYHMRLRDAGLTA